MKGWGSSGCTSSGTAGIHEASCSGSICNEQCDYKLRKSTRTSSLPSCTSWSCSRRYGWGSKWVHSLFPPCRSCIPHWFGLHLLSPLNCSSAGRIPSSISFASTFIVFSHYFLSIFAIFSSPTEKGLQSFSFRWNCPLSSEKLTRLISLTIGSLGRWRLLKFTIFLWLKRSWWWFHQDRANWVFFNSFRWVEGDIPHPQGGIWWGTFP